MSARLTKLATTPPVQGSAITATNGTRASFKTSTAHVVLAICMSECALLHTGAARAGHGHERPAFVGGTGRRAPELLAHHAAHATAHEAEVHDGQHAGSRGDRGRAGHDRLGQPAFALSFADPLRVGLEVDEAERVEGPQVAPVFDERAFVGQLGDALTGADTLVKAAGGTHRQVLFDRCRVVIGAALGTDPAALLRPGTAPGDLDGDGHPP